MSTPEAIYKTILGLLANGEKACLATVVAIKGSTPRKESAKMLIKADGTIVGSIGGGCVEAEVWQAAREVISSGQPRLLHFELTEKDALGLICGGTMDVYVEPITPTPKLIIFGGGHIAVPLAEMAKKVGFHVTVADDREPFANPTRFPNIDQVVVEDFSKVFGKLRIDSNTYLVIITRGHEHDELVLEQALNTSARYIGMIGSKKKIKTIYDHLMARGVSEGKLREVHAPIGLDIGAETPEEIAVSILAELIKVKCKT